MNPRDIYTSSSSSSSSSSSRDSTDSDVDIDFSDQILTDTENNKWILGNQMSKVTYGAIYLARKEQGEFHYVIKMEKRTSKGIEREIQFYSQMDKKKIEEFRRKQKIRCVGIPKYFGHGTWEYEGKSFNFIVLQKLGTNLGSFLRSNENVLPPEIVYTIAKQILYILEFIHGEGFVHNDIKALNLIFKNTELKATSVYLIDYGISLNLDYDHSLYQRTVVGPLGTPTYASRDAHEGENLSRRSDLEVLGYNLIEWLCGSLPWSNVTGNDAVKNEKIKCMTNIPLFIADCFFPSRPNKMMEEYFLYVANLDPKETPDYDYIRLIFSSGLVDLTE